MPRICAAILLAGIAAAALRSRRPAVVLRARRALPDDVSVSAERLMLLFGDMPSRAKHWCAGSLASGTGPASS